MLRDQDLTLKHEKEFSFSRFENLDNILETTVANLKYLQSYVRKCQVKIKKNHNFFFLNQIFKFFFNYIDLLGNLL